MDLCYVLVLRIVPGPQCPMQIRDKNKTHPPCIFKKKQRKTDGRERREGRYSKPKPIKILVSRDWDFKLWELKRRFLHEPQKNCNNDEDLGKLHYG